MCRNVFATVLCCITFSHSLLLSLSRSFYFLFLGFVDSVSHSFVLFFTDCSLFIRFVFAAFRCILFVVYVSLIRSFSLFVLIFAGLIITAHTVVLCTFCCFTVRFARYYILIAFRFAFSFIFSISILHVLRFVCSVFLFSVFSIRFLVFAIFLVLHFPSAFVHLIVLSGRCVFIVSRSLFTRLFCVAFWFTHFCSVLVLLVSWFCLRSHRFAFTLRGWLRTTVCSFDCFVTLRFTFGLHDCSFSILFICPGWCVMTLIRVDTMRWWNVMKRIVDDDVRWHFEVALMSVMWWWPCYIFCSQQLAPASMVCRSLRGPGMSKYILWQCRNVSTRGGNDGSYVANGWPAAMCTA